MSEFVALMAVMIAIPAMSIDLMLPALPDIGGDLNVAYANDRQAIIVFFFLGLAGGSLFYGPLSDHFGRRPVMVSTLALSFLMTVIAAMADSFPLMLGARMAAGFFAAACRVTVVSIVRDCFRGDTMARIMSLIMMVFIIVPMFAPSVGSFILLFGPWRTIFWILSALIFAILTWVSLRLPETLEKENRTAIRVRDIGAMAVKVMTNRNSIGHMLASGFMLAGLVGFVTSVQQIFFDVFDAEAIFPIGFAIMAGGMALGSLLNSRLVERFGARRMSQSAVICLILIAITHSLIIVSGHETMILFIIIQTFTSLCFSFAGANFSAISLEPYSVGAGLASSIQSFLTTALSAVLGGLVGAYFDGTPLPLALGFVIFGSISLLLIFWAEGWKLFRRPGRTALRENKAQL
ncbi:MAG: multidrug effflux MFS transporter [Sphingobium sp.]